jgi:hypothetical protein
MLRRHPWEGDGMSNRWKMLLLRGLQAAGLVLSGTVLTHFAQGDQRDPHEQRWANEDEVVAVEAAEFKALHKPEWREPSVAIYSAPNARPVAAQLALKDLSDSGQAHAIDLIAKGPTAANAALLRLTKTLTGSHEEIERKDPYRADRVLVATVAKGVGASPGDRLLWSRVFVQPINFEFAGYTVAQTDNRTVKVQGVESTQSTRSGVDASLPGLAKANASSSVEQTRKTTAEVNEQYENLGIDIRPDFLRIIRESTAGGDVVGNAKVELSILTDPLTIWKGAPEGADIPLPKEVLFVANAHLMDGVRYVAPADAKMTVLPQSALPHCPLKAKVWMLYEARRITRGGAHRSEGLQHVELVKGADAVREVEIVRADDIAPAVWSVRTLQEDGKVGAPLTARTEGGVDRELVFTDYVTASELTHWLRAHPPRTPLQELTFSNYSGQPLVPYKNTRNDCDRQDAHRSAGTQPHVPASSNASLDGSVIRRM